MIKKPEETQVGLRIAVYGKSGTGKTYSLSTIPDKFSVLVINVDNRLFPLIQKIRGKKNFYITEQIKDLQDFANVVNDAKNQYQFDIIVIDSFSLLQQKIGAEMASLLDDPAKRLVFYDKLYRKTLHYVDRISEVFSEKILIFTFLEDVDGLTGKFSGEIMLTGKSKPIIPSRFDLILYSCKEKNQYKWVINGEYMTKGLPGLEDVDEMPQDYAKLFEKIGVVKNGKNGGGRNGK
jgi:hypothetical protein